jgi:hypothetical protein
MAITKYTYNGVKMAAVSSFPEAAWKTSGENDSEIAELSKEVAWLYAVQRKRAGTTSGLPVELHQNGEMVDKKDWPIKIDMPDLLYRYSLAMDLFGENYMFKETKLGMIDQVRWWNPQTVTIEDNARQGLVGFTRTLGANKKLYRVIRGRSQVMWTWLPGLKEVGPGEPPGNVVEVAANILRYMGFTTKEFFERGAVDNYAFISDSLHALGDSDRKKFRRAWNNMFRAGFKKMGEILYLKSDVAMQRVNSNISEWVLPELNDMQAEHIAVAHDTPLMLLRPEQGSDKAMMQETRLAWINEVIIPHAQRMLDTLNEQLFEALGYEWIINAESMNVNQEEENSKAQSYATYINAGMPPETAVAILGIDIPDGLSIVVEAEMVEPEEEEEAPMVDARKMAELRKLDTFIENLTYLKRPFHSDILTNEEIEAALIKHDWSDYP